MGDVKESITESIKHFRSRMDISQEELSTMCGYSSTYIGKIERGQRSPSLDTLIRIAEALQIPMASLFDPFYRRQDQLKEDWDPSDFSPYDATLRRFNYVVGQLNADGTVERLFHLPWFQSETPENYGGTAFVDLPFLNLSGSLREDLPGLLETAGEGKPIHLSLKIASFDFLEETVDLIFVPFPREADDVEEVRFELFYPRVVRDGESVPLEELQFERAD